MKILLELLLFSGIFFPLYHIINALSILRQGHKKIIDKSRYFSIIIPCYNESNIIKNTIDGILRIDYPHYECIFINDGSSDNTFKRFNKLLKLEKIDRLPHHHLDCHNIKHLYKSKRHHHIYVINKDNGGKSDALNAGINYANYDYIVTLDADSILKKDALAIVSRAFNDPDVIAASGVIQVLQSFYLTKNKAETTLKINWLLRLQTIEYIKSCFCYKASLATLNSLLVISGAFGVFTKDILLAVGGFNQVIGEDLDITLRIQFSTLFKKKIAYLPNAICYTEAPETLKDYLKQRKRWQKSFIDCLFNYKDIIFKNASTKTLAFFMVADALVIGVLSSFIIVIFSLLIIQNIIHNTISYILIYFIIFISIQLTYNMAGIMVAYYYHIRYYKWDLWRLLLTVISDIFIYRIIILYTIFIGTISYFYDKRAWNKVNRSGRNYNVLKKDD